MKKLIILAGILSIGFMSLVNPAPIVRAPHSPFSILKKKNRGIIKDHGHTRGTTPKIRSGYTINKK
jgi:hypothetical protein